MFFLKSILILLSLNWSVFSGVNSTEHIIALKLGHDSTKKETLSLEAQLKSRKTLLTKSLETPLKQDIFKPSAKEFSGALKWFHQSHILGGKVKVLVLEPTLAKHPCLNCPLVSQKFDETQEKAKTDRDKKLDHATIVVSIIRSMAPHTFISILHPTDITNLDDANPSLLRTIEEGQLINQSLGIPHWKKSLEYIDKLKIILATGKPKLLIQSAGNAGRNLSDSYAPSVKEKKGLYQEWERFADHRAINEYLEVPEVQTNMIVVGAIDQNYERSSFSNYPGEKKRIQENFLCVLGRDVGSMRYDTFQYVKGTSVAAPIVTGAAALIMSQYPQFHPLIIKEILLESAEKTFFSEDPHTKEISIIYDPDDPVPDITHLTSKNYNISLKPFDPKTYGKGILSLRNAKVYAKIKEEDLMKESHNTPARLRKKMKEFLRKEEEEAARKIQKMFRRQPHTPPKGILQQKG
jgi:hypothetical protein